MPTQVCCRLFGVVIYVKCRCVCRFCCFGYNGKKAEDTDRCPVIRSKLNKEFDPINNQTKFVAKVFRNEVKLNDDEWQDNRFP